MPGMPGRCRGCTWAWFRLPGQRTTSPDRYRQGFTLHPQHPGPVPAQVYPQEEVLHVVPSHSPGQAQVEVALPPTSLLVLRLSLHYQTSPGVAGEASQPQLSLA